MATGKPKSYLDFSGGVDPNAGPYLLAENQAQDARNVHTTPTGSFRKREGFSDLVSDTGLTSRFDSLHSLAAVNLSTKSLLVSGKTASASSDRIAKIVGSTVTTLKSSLTQGKRWEWVQAPSSTGPQGPVYGVNGTDTPQQWDGSASSTSDWTATTGTVPSSAKYLLFHTDRIWATGTSSNGRVQYSGLTSATVPGPDPRNWDSDDYVDIEPDDGQSITGIGSVGPYIVVTKPRKIYAITDPVTGAWKKISDEVGCIAHRSIAETTAGTMFLSEEVGVCVTDGNTVRAIGDPVLPLIRTAATNNPTLLPYAAGFYFQHSYYLSIPYSQTYNDLLLEYDLISKSWWVHSVGSAQFALTDPGGTPKLYSASQSAVTVQRAFTPSTYQDSGSTYTAYFTGPYLIFGQPHLQKRINQIRVDARGNLTLAAATEFTGSYTALEGGAFETTDSGGTFGLDGNFGGSGTFGPTPGTAQWRFFTPLEGHPRALSLKFSNASNEDWEIQGLTVFATARSD